MVPQEICKYLHDFESVDTAVLSLQSMGAVFLAHLSAASGKWPEVK